MKKKTNRSKRLKKEIEKRKFPYTAVLNKTTGKTIIIPMLRGNN